MKLSTVLVLALIGAALIASANAEDIRRYMRLRAM